MSDQIFTFSNNKIRYNGDEINNLVVYPIFTGDPSYIQWVKFWYKPGQLFMEALIVGISFALFNAFIYWSLEKIITRWFGQPKSYKLMRIMILITISSFLSAALLHLLFELFGLNRSYILNYLQYPKGTLTQVTMPTYPAPASTSSTSSTVIQ